MIWRAWEWDWPTAAFLAWFVWFLVWETWAIVSDHPEHTWTWHLRPFIVSHPLVWFLGAALWLWIGLHFLLPALERLLRWWIRG